jgi:predicted acylesterase/phospholipase RssA/CRP-like cAMP-binding protein
VITAGLVDVLGAVGSVDAGEVLARQRKGSSVGEVAVILGEPYAETVVASIRTSGLQYPAEELHALTRQFPQIVLNVLRTAHERLAHARTRSAEARQGETVALAVGASLRGAVSGVIAAARSVTPRPVTSLDRQFSFAGAVTAADDLAASHATVLLPTELDASTVATLMREADRVVALAGTAGEAAELDVLEGGGETLVEAVLVGPEAKGAANALSTTAPVRVVRFCEAKRGAQLAPGDVAWLARHLTRTKLGLALGAGGAKGYAHVGVLQVLEEAGYTVDCVAGSSIGAIVGSYLALGAGAAEIERTLRDAYTPANVAEIFKTSLAGRATGLDLQTRLLRETTGDKTFADTTIPLTVMSVDLDQRAPAALRDGPIWEALLAATALAGVFPPHPRDGHRMVDGLALVPVPTGAVIEDGADVTVSVNLIAPEVLPRWPGGPAPEPPPERRRRGVLDDLLEVMDLSQLAQSVHHAELADVPITPLFGPGEWRDFHLADLFLAAGRAAAERQLPTLKSLALPARIDETTQEGGGIDRADAVRL